MQWKSTSCPWSCMQRPAEDCYNRRRECGLQSAAHALLLSALSVQAPAMPDCQADLTWNPPGACKQVRLHAIPLDLGLWACCSTLLQSTAELSWHHIHSYGAHLQCQSAWICASSLAGQFP